MNAIFDRADSGAHCLYFSIANGPIKNFIHSHYIKEEGLKKLFMVAAFAVGFMGIASTGKAMPVEYVKICSLYGPAFHYIPGTDVCLNDQTGETREATEGGVWTSVVPTKNPGHWVNYPQVDCLLGRLVQVGTFHPGDFTLNSFTKYQAPPAPLQLQPGEFISKVLMRGGFYDPLQPLARNPSLSTGQFCLRVADPNYFTIDMGSTPNHPTFCADAPLGCVSNSQILGTPAAYSFSVLGSPVVHYNTDSNGRVIGQPKACGSQLIVTTGMGHYDPTTISDPSQPGIPVPTAGTLSVWACVERGQGN
jgi:hypothetical protein